MRAALLCVLAVSVTACGEDDRPASWSYIHAAIIKPSCATVSCHSEQTAPRDVDLHDVDGAYELLVGKACDDVDPAPGSGSYLAAGSPDDSFVLWLLEPVEEFVTFTMPPDRLLPPADVALIGDWIAEGAKCN